MLEEERGVQRRAVHAAANAELSHALVVCGKGTEDLEGVVRSEGLTGGDVAGDQLNGSDLMESIGRHHDGADQMRRHNFPLEGEQLIVPRGNDSQADGVLVHTMNHADHAERRGRVGDVIRQEEEGRRITTDTSTGDGGSESGRGGNISTFNRKTTKHGLIGAGVGIVRRVGVKRSESGVPRKGKAIGRSDRRSVSHVRR